MPFFQLRWGSIKTRITFLILVVLIIGFWSAAFYASQILRANMEQIFGKQLLSNATFMAGEIDEELQTRLYSLKAVAGKISAAEVRNRSQSQARLEQLSILKHQFNAGLIIIDMHGKVIADSDPLAGRLDENLLAQSHIKAALQEGKSSIGKPHLADSQTYPEFGLAAPIFDSKGKVIGALAGIIDLSRPSFFDQVTSRLYGERGEFLLIAPQYNLFVTATDKSRIMHTIPAPGVNPQLDRFRQGIEEYGTAISSRGIEEVSAAKYIPSAGWFVTAVIPTSTAYAPIYDLQRRILLVVTLITLLTSALTWWILRRQLAPMLNTAKKLTELSDTGKHPQYLTIQRQDEVGELVNGFNRLLGKLEKQKVALQENETRYRTLVEWTPEAIAVHRAGKFLYVNPAAVKMFGANSSAELIGQPVLDRIHPDYHAGVIARIKKNALDGLPAPLAEEKFIKLDGTVIDVEIQGTSIIYNGESAVQAAMRDVTETRATRYSLQQQLAFTHAQNRIAKIIMESEGTDRILEGMLREVSGVLKTDRALIYDIDFNKRQVIGLCEWINPKYPNITATQGTYPLEIFISGATEIREKRSYVISHSNNINPLLLVDGSAHILHEKMQIKSALWYPVAFRNDGYYLLVLNQVIAHKEWSKTEIDFLDGASQLVSVAIEKINLLSERKLAEHDLRIAATAFEAQEGMLITDANRKILRVNRAFTQITGYEAHEVIGHNPHILSSKQQNAAFYTAMWDSINNRGGWEGEITNRRKNGEAYPEYLTISTVKDTAGVITNYVATFSDITASKMAAKEIETLAFYDPLTGLPNRRLLVDRLQRALSASARKIREGALLFIDLDHFKNINDTLGHQVGDLLLQQVAQRLIACVRDDDTVARLGGDEFVVMLEDLSANNVESATQAEAVGIKILTLLRLPYSILEREHHITPSIGVTLFNNHTTSKDDLLKQADIAMYQAKKAGRNAIRFFDPQMQIAIDTRATLEKELHLAIKDGQFELHYQIQMDEMGTPIGAEALIRWQHPERGMVLPNEFIPLAEENGLIVPIGLWVLESACAQLKKWEASPITSKLELSINVSAQQFTQIDYESQVAAAIQRHGINPNLLKQELTESMLVDNIENTIQKMMTLKEQGLRFTLDDFGTGYSSLQYLKRLPLDQLKIDQSFVQDLEMGSSNRTIIRTIIAMASSLNLSVIAEGVETQQQRDLLIKKGCLAFQGYLFGRPCPIEQFEASLSLCKKRTG
ncbi:MAG: EAL domain-containing protein [Sideroxydans sp.]|nr:EAL domain-containing protein [Sideroxydans sp.]